MHNDTSVMHFKPFVHAGAMKVACGNQTGPRHRALAKSTASGVTPIVWCRVAILEGARLRQQSTHANKAGLRGIGARANDCHPRITTPLPATQQPSWTTRRIIRISGCGRYLSADTAEVQLRVSVGFCDHASTLMGLRAVLSTSVCRQSDSAQPAGAVSDAERLVRRRALLQEVQHSPAAVRQMLTTAMHPLVHSLAAEMRGQQSGREL